MHKWKQNICRVLLAAALGAAAAGTAMAEGSDTFVSGTTINGIGVSGKTVAEAEAQIGNFYSGQYQLKIRKRGGSYETITGSEIGFQVALPAGYLQQLLNEQNAAGRASGPDVGTRYRVAMANTYNEQALANRFNSLSCISGSTTPVANAYISAYEAGKPFVIVPEVWGDTVNRERAAEVIRAAVVSGATEVDLEQAGCYEAPQVTSADPALNALCDTMNRCREMTVTYVFGETQEVLDAGTICSWLLGTQNGELQLDRNRVLAYVQALAAKYDTVGTTRVFRTASGRDVELTGPYGWKINQQAETDTLIAIVRSGMSQTREPVYEKTAASRIGGDWGNTYVEVDLTGQQVYMFQNGLLVWNAPCVTGNTSRGNGTPAGIYSLNYKERNRVLRGPRRADGSYEYESPVSYWMPFNGGIGLHDANWRGKFGGTIYQTSGSHGCVNLPPATVGVLYELVYPGIPVLCYF